MPETMDDLELAGLDMLVKGWQEYAAAHPGAHANTREAGFQSALRICAEQLAETLERMRADA